MLGARGGARGRLAAAWRHRALARTGPASKRRGMGGRPADVLPAVGTTVTRTRIFGRSVPACRPPRAEPPLSPLWQEVAAFAAVTGDDNPLHGEGPHPSHAPFGGAIVHGVLLNGLLSGLIAAELGGERCARRGGGGGGGGCSPGPLPSGMRGRQGGEVLMRGRRSGHAAAEADAALSERAEGG